MSAVVKEIESTASVQDERRPADRRYRGDAGVSPFAALMLLACALTGWAAFQTYLLVHESMGLTTMRDNQNAPVTNAEKLRQALDAVARDTAKLADRGNPNARLVVEELRKRGVTINPDTTASPSVK